MRSRCALITLAAALPVSMASAATVTLDFEDAALQGQTVGNYFESNGITFAGTLFTAVDYGGYPVSDPVVRNLRAMWGADIDTEAISTGSGAASATIGFEAVAGNVLSSVNFMVARIISQEITVIAREAGTGQLFTHTFASSGTGGFNDDRTVEEFAVNLDTIFAGLNSRQWTEIAVHNHGGMFGVDNVNYEYSLEVPGAGAIAGLLGIAGLRSRRR